MCGGYADRDKRTGMVFFKLVHSWLPLVFVCTPICIFCLSHRHLKLTFTSYIGQVKAPLVLFTCSILAVHLQYIVIHLQYTCSPLSHSRSTFCQSLAIFSITCFISDFHVSFCILFTYWPHITGITIRISWFHRCYMFLYVIYIMYYAGGWCAFPPSPWLRPGGGDFCTPHISQNPSDQTSVI